MISLSEYRSQWIGNIRGDVRAGGVVALAILIFMPQLTELELSVPGITRLTYGLVAVGLAIICLLPRLTTAIPSPLVTTVVLTVLVTLMGWDVRTVGDMGALPDTLPVLLIPDMPSNLSTLRIILPYSVAMAIVGLRDSLMTQTIVDDLTDTKSDRNRECIGQGIANTAPGFIGGIVMPSGIFFAARIAQLFYGSAEDFADAFDVKEAVEKVAIDVSGAHIWDISPVQALDMAILTFRRDGAEVELVGMNAASETLVDRPAIHDKPGALDTLMAH